MNNSQKMVIAIAITLFALSGAIFAFVPALNVVGVLFFFWPMKLLADLPKLNEGEPDGN